MMAIHLTSAQLTELAPNARTVYRTAFDTADTVLATHGINSNSLRLSHFMAQVLHETGGLTILVENMNYSAKRMTQVWPKRFPSIESALPFAHNPTALADNVYGGRMGNNRPHDGSAFIGRGLLQITGRDSYEKYGGILGVDLAGHSDLAIDPIWTLKVASEEWNASGCNAIADADNLRKLTQTINGGLIGFASREDWLVKTKHVWLLN